MAAVKGYAEWLVGVITGFGVVVTERQEDSETKTVSWIETTDTGAKYRHTVTPAN